MSHRNESGPEAFFARTDVGAVLEGDVVDVKPFGAFVELADGVHGLLHESEWAARPELGATVRVEVLAVDPDRRRLSLRPA